MFSKALSVCRPERLAVLLFSLTLLLALPLAVAAEAATWRQAVAELKVSGSGRMTFFGLTIYDATLWTASGRWKAGELHALELVYARTISREQLVKSSIEEMQRTGTSREQAEAWADDMRRVFADVRPGDRLVGVFHPERGAAFYSDRGLTGEINDPAFARAFAAIWLDPRTREPDLRRKLLNGSS